MLKLTFILATLLIPCTGSGLLMVTSRRGKCMTVKSSKFTELEIQWEAPSQKNKAMDKIDGLQEKLIGGMQDTKKNFQDKRQQMQEPGIDDALAKLLGTAAVDQANTKKPFDRRSELQISAENVPSGPEEKMQYFQDQWKPTGNRKNRKLQPISQTVDVDRQFGSFRFKLTEYDDLHLCVSSMLASIKKPELVGIRVKEAVAIAKATKQQGETPEDKRLGHEKMEQGRNHMKLLERELNQFISRANAIEKNMHSSKVSQSEFHDTSVKMQKAAIWYPIVQIIVILVTAVLNAKSMVKMLRKKGVIYF